MAKQQAVTSIRSPLGLSSTVGAANNQPVQVCAQDGDVFGLVVGMGEKNWLRVTSINSSSS